MGNHLCSSLNAAFAQKNIFHPTLQCTVQYFIPPQCTVQYFIPPYSVLYNISYFKYNAESPKQGSKRFNSNVKTINIVPLGIIYLCRRQSKERLGGQMFGRHREGAVRSLTNIYSLVGTLRKTLDFLQKYCTVIKIGTDNTLAQLYF